jgi:ATP-dependent Zn protease
MVDLAGIGTSAFKILVMILTILIVGGLMVGITFLVTWYRKYSQYQCVIFKRDGFGQLTQAQDTAGVFVDSKTKNKRLYLRRNKVGLNADKIPYIPIGGKKVIYLLQTGLKNFHYIKVNINEDNIMFSVGEEDVNWSINTYERGKKLFSQSLLMQLLPFMLVAFVTIIILVIFIYFFKEFSTLKDFAALMKDTSANLASAKTGTTVIPGGSG